VDMLITDSELHPEARALLAEKVGQLIIADGPTSINESPAPLTR
jgi:hypothetical protein